MMAAPLQDTTGAVTLSETQVEARRPTPRPSAVPIRFPGAVPSTELWVGIHLPEAAEDPTRLERVASCAQHFTPRISLVPPDGVVLEVKGSLHLFGGVQGLSRALASECVALG